MIMLMVNDDHNNHDDSDENDTTNDPRDFFSLIIKNDNVNE